MVRGWSRSLVRNSRLIHFVVALQLKQLAGATDRMFRRLIGVFQKFFSGGIKLSKMAFFS